MDTNGTGVHVVTQVMAIAIRAEEGWPIEAVLANRDNPEGPLHRWREGALSDAPEIEVDEVLASLAKRPPGKSLDASALPRKRCRRSTGTS